MSCHFLVLWRRSYQKYTHPHLFVRTILLSDGSTQQITTLSPSPYNPPPTSLGTRNDVHTSKKESKTYIKHNLINEVDPFDDAAIKSFQSHSNPIPLKLNADSNMHPSWNRHKRKGVGVGKGEGVEKFRGRFGSDMDDILLDMVEDDDEPDDLTVKPDTIKKVVIKKKLNKK